MQQSKVSFIGAAELLGVSIDEIKKLVKEGKLEANDERITIESIFKLKKKESDKKQEFGAGCRQNGIEHLRGCIAYLLGKIDAYERILNKERR